MSKLKLLKNPFSNNVQSIGHFKIPKLISINYILAVRDFNIFNLMR